MNDMEDYQDLDAKQGLKSKILCNEISGEQVLSFRPSIAMSNSYIFLLLVEGQAQFTTYLGRESELQAGNLYICAPGFPITITQVSKNFNAFCFIADQTLTFEVPFVRNMIRTAYFPVTRLNEPRLVLTKEQTVYMANLMRNIIQHQESTSRFKQESLRALYSLFLLDLMDIEEHTQWESQMTERTERLFIDFIQLVQKHFIAHHDITFYADKLFISTTYLSRIVKKITGNTVVDFINRLLLMEASHLLLTTEMPIADIAQQLNFSDQVSFSRFFLRMNGNSPKQFRMKQ